MGLAGGAGLSPAHKGHTMPEKTLKTKGIAEVSAAQLRIGAATGEGARG